MTEKEQELIDIILAQRKHIIYLALEYKGERMQLNAEGLSALQFLRDIYNIEAIDNYLKQVNDYLEENYDIYRSNRAAE